MEEAREELHTLSRQALQSNPHCPSNAGLEALPSPQLALPLRIAAQLEK